MTKKVKIDENAEVANLESSTIGTEIIARSTRPRVHQIKMDAATCRSLCSSIGLKYLGKDDDGHMGYEERVFEYVLTDETVDHYGDVVMANGGDLSIYRRNPVVLAFHDGRSFNIGMSLKTWYDEAESNVKGWVLFFDNRLDKTPSQIAETAYQYVSNGAMKTGSIGFIPDTENGIVRPTEEERKSRKMSKYGLIYTKWTLKEFSVTPVPANPNATMKDAFDLFSRDGVEAAMQQSLLTQEERNLILTLLDSSSPAVTGSNRGEGSDEGKEMPKSLDGSSALNDVLTKLNELTENIKAMQVILTTLVESRELEGGDVGHLGDEGVTNTYESSDGDEDVEAQLGIALYTAGEHIRNN